MAAAVAATVDLPPRVGAGAPAAAAAALEVARRERLGFDRINHDDDDGGDDSASSSEEEEEDVFERSRRELDASGRGVDRPPVRNIAFDSGKDRGGGGGGDEPSPAIMRALSSFSLRSAIGEQERREAEEEDEGAARRKGAGVAAAAEKAVEEVLAQDGKARKEKEKEKQGLDVARFSYDYYAHVKSNYGDVEGGGARGGDDDDIDDDIDVFERSRSVLTELVGKASWHREPGEEDDDDDDEEELEGPTTGGNDGGEDVAPSAQVAAAAARRTTQPYGMVRGESVIDVFPAAAATAARTPRPYSLSSRAPSSRGGSRRDAVPVQEGEDARDAEPEAEASMKKGGAASTASPVPSEKKPVEEAPLEGVEIAAEAPPPAADETGAAAAKGRGAAGLASRILGRKARMSALRKKKNESSSVNKGKKAKEDEAAGVAVADKSRHGDDESNAEAASTSASSSSPSDASPDRSAEDARPAPGGARDKFGLRRRVRMLGASYRQSRKQQDRDKDAAPTAPSANNEAPATPVKKDPSRADPARDAGTPSTTASNASTLPSPGRRVEGNDGGQSMMQLSSSARTTPRSNASGRNGLGAGNTARLASGRASVLLPPAMPGGIVVVYGEEGPNEVDGGVEEEEGVEKQAEGATHDDAVVATDDADATAEASSAPEKREEARADDDGEGEIKPSATVDENQEVPIGGSKDVDDARNAEEEADAAVCEGGDCDDNNTIATEVGPDGAAQVDDDEDCLHIVCNNDDRGIIDTTTDVLVEVSSTAGDGEDFGGGEDIEVIKCMGLEDIGNEMLAMSGRDIGADRRRGENGDEDDGATDHASSKHTKDTKGTKLSEKTGKASEKTANSKDETLASKATARTLGSRLGRSRIRAAADAVMGALGDHGARSKSAGGRSRSRSRPRARSKSVTRRFGRKSSGAGEEEGAGEEGGGVGGKHGLSREAKEALVKSSTDSVHSLAADDMQPVVITPVATPVLGRNANKHGLSREARAALLAGEVGLEAIEVGAKTKCATGLSQQAKFALAAQRAWEDDTPPDDLEEIEVERTFSDNKRKVLRQNKIMVSRRRLHHRAGVAASRRSRSERSTCTADTSCSGDSCTTYGDDAGDYDEVLDRMALIYEEDEYTVEDDDSSCSFVSGSSERSDDDACKFEPCGIPQEEIIEDLVDAFEDTKAHVQKMLRDFITGDDIADALAMRDAACDSARERRSSSRRKSRAAARRKDDSGRRSRAQRGDGDRRKSLSGRDQRVHESRDRNRDSGGRARKRMEV